MSIGKPLSAIMAELCLPMISQISRTPMHRLLDGMDPSEDLSVIATAVPAIRTLMNAGKNEQAHKQFLLLPKLFQESKAGMSLLMQITQPLDENIYLGVLADIDRRFPNDSTMGMVLLDWHLLEHRFTKALDIIDHIEKEIGGDPYLNNIRAVAHSLADELTIADELSARVCADFPDLVDVWWIRVSITLKRKDHALTVRLLNQMTEKFEMTYADLTTIPDYADFVASPEYKVWIQQQESAAPAGDEKPLPVSDQPSPAPVTP
jgi:hypothetical protein